MKKKVKDNSALAKFVCIPVFIILIILGAMLDIAFLIAIPLLAGLVSVIKPIEPLFVKRSHAALIFLIALVTLGVSQGDKAVDEARQKRQDSQQQVALAKKQEIEQADPKTNLEKAKGLLAEVQKQTDPDAASTQLDSVQARLNAIPESAPEFMEAKKLKTDVQGQRVKVEKNKQFINETAGKITRDIMAKKMEEFFLDKGMDVFVTIRGRNKDILHMKYILFSRPTIRQFTKNAELMHNLKEAGFKKLEFENGDGVMEIEFTE